MSVWDDPDLNTSNDFVTFTLIGDSVAGRVTRLGVHKWPDGKVSPEIGITTDTGDDVTLTAGPYRLKIKLAEERPEVGDHLTVTFRSVDKLEGGKTAKNFDVVVKRAAASTTAAAPAAGEPPF